MSGLASTGTWLARGGWQTVGVVALVGLLVAAAWVDARERRIPNALVFSGAVVALLIAHMPGGSVSGSVTGIAVGVAMSLPLYWLHAMGAGDVKLMGMAGAFLGGAHMFAAALVIFLIGGLFGLVAVWRRRAFVQLGANLKQMTFGRVVDTMTGAGPAIEEQGRSVGVQPYGVAIAVGVILYLTMIQAGFFP